MTTAAAMRAWTGPAILTYGFRPFFLGGAVWAAGAMGAWVLMLMGALDLPSRFDPVSWHAHAFLFGYVGAIIAGFLLTAVPNWTGRLPVTGWALGGLVALWVAGRVAVSISALLPAYWAAAIDLAFPLVLGAVILREIVSGTNWRNLPVLGLLAVFATANAWFHCEAALGYAAVGRGLRLGLAAVLVMIALIGGRIVPSFTRNWLVKQGSEARPAAPMGGFDRVAMLATAAGLLMWVVWPAHPLTGAALLAIAVFNVARLARWQGWRTRAEPLVLVLHAAYAFVPLGALLLGAAILAPEEISSASVQHVWMAGALGLMTLAVMTRATLGHTGGDLTAGPGTVAIYSALLGSVVARALSFGGTDLLALSAVLWIAAFGGFAWFYGPLLLRPRDPA